MIICLSVSDVEGLKKELRMLFFALMSFTQYKGLLNAITLPENVGMY
jgi:hypothetical protein